MLRTMRITNETGHRVDLAAVASAAARSLDELTLGRTQDLSAVESLVTILSSDLKSTRSMDLSTASAVQHALADGSHENQAVPIGDFLERAKALTSRLNHVVQTKDLGEARDLRDLCVALSRSAIALSTSVYDRMPLPYRF